MKKVKVSLLALCALAGGAMVASAAKGDKGFTYDLDVAFTNPVSIVDVHGVPTLKTNFTLLTGDQGLVTTDGSGKLDGVWDMYVTNLTDAAPLVDGDYIVDISGSITTVTKTGNPNPVPVVNMTLKGSGQSHDDADTTNAAASFNLTFNTKNSTGVSTNSSSASFGTNNVTEITEFSDGTFFTNSIPTKTYSPRTNFVVRSGPLVLPFLTFRIDTSDTNSVPIVQNSVFEQSGALSTNLSAGFVTFYFGSGTLVSNVYFLFGTNFFQVSQLGTNLSYTAHQNLGATNLTVDTGSTNPAPVYGIDIGSVTSFINAFTQFRTSTSNPISLISSVVTNTQNAGTTGSATNGSFVTGIPTYSNSWFEVNGLINGSVKQSKKATQVKNATGLFAQNHTLYTPTLVIVTNAAATNSYITNQAVIIQNVSGGGFTLESTESFTARLVQFNKTITTSSGDPYKGTGTLNPTKTKQTYTLNLKGVSQSRGSSLTFKGNTASNYVAGFTALTNLYTVTNIATVAKFNHTFTNTTGFSQFQNFAETVTNTVVTITGTTNVVFHNTYGVTVPGLGNTNIDTIGIRTVTATGKVQGQSLPKAGISGTNADNVIF